MSKRGISFICPSYNHEKYICKFINSVINQTCSSWELIIVDDCSTDKNVYNAKSIIDNRIHIIEHEYNKGISYGIMDGVDISTYDIISIIASDDLLMPEYVEKVIHFFEIYDCDILYSPLCHIDQNGSHLSSITTLPYHKSQEEIFVDSFLGENQLPSPGMAIKRSRLLKIFPLHTGIIQYHDWQLHMLLMYKAKIFLSPEPLLYYRQTPRSVCKITEASSLRSAAETDVLMDTVVQLIGDDCEAFLSYFSSRKNEKWTVSAKTIPLHLAWIALHSSDLEKRKWGIRKIINIISNRKRMQDLHELCGFTFKDYMDMAVYASTFPDRDKIEKRKLSRRIKTWRAACLIISALFLLSLLWR